MTATKVQAKLESMTADEACTWIIDHYNGMTQDMIVIRFDGANAAAPVSVNGQGTQYQVAHFRHSSQAAVRTLGTEWNVSTVFVVGCYWEQDYQGRGRWTTSVHKYVRRQR